MRQAPNEAADAYHAEVMAAKRAQRVPYAIAPRQFWQTSRRRFNPGDELTESDLDVPGGHSASGILSGLVAGGIVLQVEQRLAAFTNQSPRRRATRHADRRATR